MDASIKSAAAQRGRGLVQKKGGGGIKFNKGNKENFRGKSYRDLWQVSGKKDTFENWLRSEGIDLSKYCKG